MVLGTFIEVCNHHHLISEYFRHHKRNPTPLSSHSHSLSREFPAPRQPLFTLCLYGLAPTLDILYKWYHTMHYVLFCDGLLSLSVCLQFVRVAACITTSITFMNE